MMTACLSDLVAMWERQAWSAHAQGRTEAAQALRGCADRLAAALDSEPRESCEWPPGPWPGETKPTPDTRTHSRRNS